MIFAVQNAFACPSVDQITEIQVALKIQEYKRVWPGFSKTRLVFAFTDKASALTQFIGATEDEITKLGIEPKKCQIAEGVSSFEVPGAPLPTNGLFDIRMTKNPGSDILGSYVAENNQTLIQIQQPNNYGFDSVTVARTVIHEAFHGTYQFSSSSFKVGTVEPREFLKNCSKNSLWVKSTLKQFLLLSESLETNDQSRLEALLEAIQTERRILAQDPEALSCLKAQRFWERLEGSAHYVESESAIQAGLITPTELLVEVNKVLLAQEITDGFFYRSGSTLIRLLVKINGTSTFDQIDEDDFMPVPLNDAKSASRGL